MNKLDEATASNRNHRLLLEMMLDDVKKMIRDRSDKVLNRYRPSQLSQEDVDRLLAVSEKIKQLLARIQAAEVGENILVRMFDLCDSSVHLKHLKYIPVVTLDEFHSCDPLLLQQALYGAEQEAGGNRQHHLFTRMDFKVKRLAEDLHKPKKS